MSGTIGIELAPNALLVGDGDELTAYDPKSLDERWTVDARDAGAAHAHDGSVYLLTAEDLIAVN